MHGVCFDTLVEFGKPLLIGGPSTFTQICPRQEAPVKRWNQN